jgi:hypothetical protein
MARGPAIDLFFSSFHTKISPFRPVLDNAYILTKMTPKKGRWVGMGKKKIWQRQSALGKLSERAQGAGARALTGSSLHPLKKWVGTP